MKLKSSNSNNPVWKNVTIKMRIPESLKNVERLAHNLWWTWNNEAIELFKSMDPDLYRECGKNPVAMLGRMSYGSLNNLAANKEFLERANDVCAKFDKYMKVKPDTSRPSVAYFCMEYGLSNVLKIYSGGLGILAGDYIKQASDSNVDMCAVGFLYRYGYFDQSLAMDGQQIANYEAQDFENLPIEKVFDKDGKQQVVEVPFPNYTVYAYVWKVNVGRVTLYLLDTDNDMNSELDRNITKTLYGGDWENRLKQEYLLGIGGVLMLKKLGIKKDIYHCNEGHAALCNVQRLVDYVQEGKLSFNEALELVRASSLYTVHTPVPAGHDYFDEGLFGKYLGSYPEKLGITWDEFIGMGRTDPDNHGEKFCMSTFLCNTCQEVNGVSLLHGKVSQKMFNGIWKGYFPEENHVGYVTNGVHYPSWAAKEWKALYNKYFDKSFLDNQSDEKIWSAIYDVPDEKIWDLRVALKTKLIDYIRIRFRQSWLKNQSDPTRIISLLEKINPNALLIGFSRRFATYKRAHLLFNDLDRLAKIVNNENCPVQFIFAGKAHPADGAGQGLIKQIYEISKRPEFLGKIIFLENYEMELARRLISGVDIWLNTPTRLMEASGTSGEKALMNGVINFSVLDGWWYEGYREGAGWAITDYKTYQNQAYQDSLDASTIYSMLEHEIIPLYYSFSTEGYSKNWVAVIKNSIAKIAPHYTMKRQLDDYYSKFYNKEYERFQMLSANNNQKAIEIAAWKETVAQRWDSIKVVSTTASDNIKSLTLESGNDFEVTHVVDEQGLDDAVGIDFVIMGTGKNNEDYLIKSIPMQMVKREGNLYTFNIKTHIDFAGTAKVAFRMYPKHKLLPHRQDFCYVRWF